MPGKPQRELGFSRHGTMPRDPALSAAEWSGPNMVKF